MEIGHIFKGKREGDSVLFASEQCIIESVVEHPENRGAYSGARSYWLKSAGAPFCVTVSKDGGWLR